MPSPPPPPSPSPPSPSPPPPPPSPAPPPVVPFSSILVTFSSFLPGYTIDTFYSQAQIDYLQLVMDQATSVGGYNLRVSILDITEGTEGAPAPGPAADEAAAAAEAASAAAAAEEAAAAAAVAAQRRKLQQQQQGGVLVQTEVVFPGDQSEQAAAFERLLRTDTAWLTEAYGEGAYLQGISSNSLRLPPSPPRPPPDPPSPPEAPFTSPAELPSPPAEPPIPAEQPSPASPSPEAPPVPAPVEPNSAPSSSSTPVGAIVGGVVGGVALLAAALLTFFYVRRRRQRQRPSALSPSRRGSGRLGASGRLSSGQLPPSVTTDPAASNLLPAGSERSARLARSPSQRAAPAERLAGEEQGVVTGSPRFWTHPGPGSESLHSLEGDPLLAFIATHLATARQRQPQPRRLPDLPEGVVVQWEALQLERPIGKGSLGRVYLARLNAVPVAVRILISADGYGGAEDLQLPGSVMSDLQEEAAAMCRVRHPCIARLVGLCLLPPCILTEHCRNGSLREVLRQGCTNPEAARMLTWQLRLSWACDAARALAHLHAASPSPLAHGGLKSTNVLLDEAWHVKVCDAGLSDALRSVKQAEEDAMWLAPEVMEGRPATPAADVFSLGCVLLELLTWRLPWAGTPTTQVRGMVLRGDRPEVPPLALLPGPSAEPPQGLDAYCRLMRECWAARPGSRPSAAAVVERLRGLLGSLSAAGKQD